MKNHHHWTRGTAAAALLLLVAAPVLVAAPALAQDASVTVHGHANNPIGQAMSGDQVKFTHDLTGELKDRKFIFSFTTDANGDFTGKIQPGVYFVELADGPKSVDFVDSLEVKAGDDKTINFDLTRQAYMDKMTPAERTQIEEYKKKNAAIMASNVNVGNLNKLLTSTRADLATPSPNYDSDISQLQAASAANPNEPLLFGALGGAMIAKADSLAAADRAAHKIPASDPDVQKAYADGIAADTKSNELDAASKKPLPDNEGILWNQIGTADAKIGKTDDAQAAFEQAVKLSPTKAGIYYANEAAVLFNAGSTEAAGAAAEKAIAADPTRPDPYYIKGQALIGKSTVDKAGKVVPPPGCIDAYEKYLEIAPEGKFAPEIKQILTGLGQTIKTTYRAGHK